MSLKLIYRPMAGVLSITDTSTNYDIDDCDRWVYPDVESHTVGVLYGRNNDDTITVITMTVIDLYNDGSSWSVWASEWLSDETITSIYELVNGWHDHWADTMADADVRTKVLAKYETHLDKSPAR